MPVARRFVQAFNRRAEFAVRRGHANIRLEPKDTDGIRNALLDLMVEGYVKRYQLEKKRVITRSSRQPIELGYSSVVTQMARDLDLDLGDIRDSFDWFVKGNVKKSVDRVETRIDSIIGDVASQQLPTGTAVREVRRQLEDAGISVKKPNTVETLVRTQSQVAFGAAQWQLNEDTPDGLIWGYTYAAVMDDRTRETHAEMNGVTRPKDDPIWDVWWPPNGWNCRCQCIAVLGEAQETDVPDDAEPDDGFDFNAGKLLD